MASQFDVVVVGGGPGGYVAAIRAAQLGLNTAVVEREHLGGICLNWGCIPTKALLRSSEMYHNMQNAAAYGLKADNVSFDLQAIVKRSRGVSGQLSAGVKTLLKKNKVQVFDGEAKLTGKNTLTVSKDGKAVGEVSFKHVILATGARPRELPHLKADGKLIWNYKHALVPDTVPGRLLVVGSGAIGVEFASFFSDMGSRVTIIEMIDRILPVEDEEVSAFVTKAFTKQGITVRTRVGLSKLETKGQTVTATIEADGKNETHEFDRVILAIGIQGNVENLGLEDLGVQVERGQIATDGYGRTNVPGVWAIGDVAGAPWLAHKASHEGVTAAEAIAVELGKGEGLHPHPLNKANIPGCTYCRPQVASVGLTEAKAKDAGYEVRVGKFPFIGNGKAIALGEPEGFIKTVFDAKTGEMLGAHMVGAEVTELIQGYVVARQLETTEAELMQTIFAHPTLSEMMHEAVLAAYGRAIHF